MKTICLFARFPLVLLVTCIAVGAAHTTGTDDSGWHHRHRTFAVEVAENPQRFVFDQGGPLHPDGTPAHGNAFVTQGCLYPPRARSHGRAPRSATRSS